MNKIYLLFDTNLEKINESWFHSDLVRKYEKIYYSEKYWTGYREKLSYATATNGMRLSIMFRVSLGVELKKKYVVLEDIDRQPVN